MVATALCRKCANTPDLVADAWLVIMDHLSTFDIVSLSQVSNLTQGVVIRC